MSLVMFRRGRVLKLTIVVFCLVLLILFLLPGERGNQLLEPVSLSRTAGVSYCNCSSLELNLAGLLYSHKIAD